MQRPWGRVLLECLRKSKDVPVAGDARMGGCGRNEAEEVTEAWITDGLGGHVKTLAFAWENKSFGESCAEKGVI